MANEIEHKLRAENNERLLDKIDDQFIDWKYVILYYSALHFADAFLAKHGINKVIDHNDRRKKYGKKLPQNVFASYKILENSSKIARYHPEMSHLLSNSDFENLYKKYFTQVKLLF